MCMLYAACMSVSWSIENKKLIDVASPKIAHFYATQHVCLTQIYAHTYSCMLSTTWNDFKGEIAIVDHCRFQIASRVMATFVEDVDSVTPSASVAWLPITAN